MGNTMSHKPDSSRHFFGLPEPFPDFLLAQANAAMSEALATFKAEGRIEPTITFVTRLDRKHSVPVDPAAWTRNPAGPLAPLILMLAGTTAADRTRWPTAGGIPLLMQVGPLIHLAILIAENKPERLSEDFGPWPGPMVHILRSIVVPKLIVLTQVGASGLLVPAPPESDEALMVIALNPVKAIALVASRVRGRGCHADFHEAKVFWSMCGGPVVGGRWNDVYASCRS